MSVETLHIPPPITFQAKWDNIEHLRENFIFSIVKKVLLLGLAIKIPTIGALIIANWGFQILIRRIILPASTYTPETILPNDSKVKDMQDAFNRIWYSLKHSSTSLRQKFTARSFRLKTPDGAIIAGTHFRYKKAPSSSPTVILYLGNAVLSQFGSERWMLEHVADENPHHFVVFDHRGCGESTDGTLGSRVWSKREMLIDAETVRQFVANHFRVPKNHTRHFAFSLGGGVFCESGISIGERAVLDRTFSSIKKVVEYLPNQVIEEYKRRDIEIKTTDWSFLILQKIIRIVQFIISIYNWNFDNTAVLKRLAGKVLVINHIKDPIINFPASLCASSCKMPEDTSSRNIQLLPLCAGEDGINHHCTPLERYRTERASVGEIAIKFLLDNQEDVDKAACALE